VGEKMTSEKILTSIAILMGALIISYNLFFIPKIPMLEPTKNKIILQNSKPKQKTKNTININLASIEEMTQLNGIGPAIAKRIIDYRENNGGFLDINEIKNVKGIGEKIFKKIKNNIKI
jgi:competence protein ComEA